jgi:hypothetical protein
LRAVVFTPLLGIVLGDNKKNKTPTLANNRISIKYALVFKSKIFKKDRSKITFSGLFLPWIL